MTTIFLRYGNYDEGDIVWSEPMEFAPSRVIPIFLNTRITGVDLRDIEFNHLVAKRTKSIEITLVPHDLVDDDKFNFIIEFFNAMAWEYNFANDDWESEAVRVQLEEKEKLEYEIINNHKQLRKLRLTLIQKTPD
jgi:hypothetical protein